MCVLSRSIRQRFCTDSNAMASPGQTHLLLTEGDGLAIGQGQPRFLQSAVPISGARRARVRPTQRQFAAGQVDQHLPSRRAGAVDQFVIRLIEVRQKAAVTATHAAIAVSVNELRRVGRLDGLVDIVEVHDGKRSLGHLPQSKWVLNQAAQDASAAFGGLIGEDSAAIVARRQWFAKYLAFLKLKPYGDARISACCTVAIVLSARFSGSWNRIKSAFLRS